MIGIGTDLVDLDRFRAALERTPGLKRRCFTADEQAYAERRDDPVERYAARFAAKEAVMKAMGTGMAGASFREIRIRHQDSGQPFVELLGATRKRAQSMGIGAWHLSITHTRKTAAAVAIALPS